MTIRYIANDIGTTNIKSLIAGSNNKVEFPAITGNWQEMFNNDYQFVKIDSKVNRFIGQSAINFSTSLNWGRTKSWLLSEDYLALHLYAIASHIGKTTRTVEVSLGTAVPRANYKREQREAIASYLKGEYSVMIEGREYPLVIIVSDVFIGLQGWTAALAESNGQWPIAYVGIGGRNAIYTQLHNAHTPDPSKTGSLEKGFLDVIDTFIRQVANEYDIELNHQQAIQMFKNRKVGGYDVSNLVAKIKAEYLSDLTGYINQIWNEREEMPLIPDFIIGGGGAFELGQDIVNLYPNARVANDPLWCEAKGILSNILP